MADLSSRLDALGDAVAEVSDRTADPATLVTARRQLQAAVVAGPARRRPYLWAVAAAAVAAVVVLAVMGVSRRPVATFEVGSPPVPGTVGAWVAAEQSQLGMRFSEGSTLRLEPGTRLRVTETTADGATLLIERGDVHAEIVHSGPNSRWLLQAGPFAVRVVGTRFVASWDPNEEILRVVVFEGLVSASGPLLPAERRVAAGEQLVVSVRDGTMDLRTAAQTTSSATAADVADADGPSGAGAGGHTTADALTADSGSAEGGAPAAGSASSWRQLAAARNYREAMNELERQGFDAVAAQASAGDLLALADVARFAGQPARARQTLLLLRSRHGASHSAFLLGRIAIDQLGAPADAVRWFETYLQEQPGGPLAEQALGRILDIQRHGSPQVARQAAERYLARYPNGAYANVARSVLSP